MKKEIPSFLVEMSKQLNEQNNRMTADPIFCVYYNEKVPTSEDYADGYEWFNADKGKTITEDDEVFIDYLCENYPEYISKICESYEIEKGEVNIFYIDEDELPSDIIKTYYLNKKHFIKASLTEAGAEQFINRKRHDYPSLYIYAESMCYQWQMIELRKWIMSLAICEGDSDVK